MNQKNLDYIKNGLKELGFGDKQYPDLETTLAQGKPRVTFLHRTTINGFPVLSSIHLEKSSQSDKYRISKYDTMIKKEPDHYDNEIQTFFINKNKGVTLKEAYNLLEGRSVLKPFLNKEGKVEREWLELSFRKQDRAGNFIVNKYGESHGFDLGKALSELPIKESRTPQRNEMLMRSLEKGNAEIVTVAKNGLNEKVFIEANPRAKAVNLYDKDLRKVETQSLITNEALDKPQRIVKNSVAEKQAVTNGQKPRSAKKGLSH